MMLLLVNASTTIAKGKGKGKHRIEKMNQELGLSDEQFLKLKEFRKANKNKRGGRGEMKALREEMKNAFISNQPDSKLKEIHQKIVSKMSEKGEMRFNKMIFMKNLLNDEQRQTFMEMREKRKGPRKGHRRGPHSEDE